MLHFNKIKNNILYRSHLYLHLKNKFLLTILLQFSLIFLLTLINIYSCYIANQTECFSIATTRIDSALSNMESGQTQESTPIPTTTAGCMPIIILVAATSFWGTLIYLWLRFS